jgi:hypothetical protein
MESMTCLMLSLTCRADVAAGMGGPGDAIYTCSMVVQSSHGGTGHSHIQNNNLLACIKKALEKVQILA